MTDSSPQISAADVRHVAKLARLKLDDAQVHAMSEQLSRVLGYVSKLNELDVEGVEPMAHAADVTNRLDDDVPVEPWTSERLLQNAPDKYPPFFKVPKVIGESSA